MKNPLYFAITVLVLFMGFFLLFLKFIFPIGLIVLFIGLLLMIHWHTISYQWVCNECSNIFGITMFRNLIGINGGINRKYLNCPSCKKKTWCKGVPK